MAKDKTPKNIIRSEHHAAGLETLADNLTPLIKRLLGGKGLVQIELFAEWKKIVGETLASYTVPEKINFKKDCRTDGILHLIVRDGAYALEIMQQKPLIMEKINTYFGYRAITDLRLNINDMFFNSEAPIKDDDKPEKNLVNTVQKNYIEQLTEDIQNPELRARLQKLGESILKNNR